ncbi:phenylacetic acid degradation protein PaaD, thioesterase [Klebsiella pneumoniae]|nr:phenylacetic acid degradation protein PaaD, thioesterase [Klebsiella pneumoniae]
MLNGHQTCHGGQLFTLADTAFAYACNSQGLAAVASAASIDFLRPAFAGDRLVATARVKQQGKLTGVYDIEIVNQQQRLWPCSAANRTASAAQSRETCNARRLYL